MVTVFELATPEELVGLFGKEGPNLPEHLCDYKLERQGVIEDSDYNFAKLASLYAMRGDMRQADEYIAQIQDIGRRLSTKMLYYECTPGR